MMKINSTPIYALIPIFLRLLAPKKESFNYISPLSEILSTIIQQAYRMGGISERMLQKTRSRGLRTTFMMAYLENEVLLWHPSVFG
jgi:hypothetical protein